MVLGAGVASLVAVGIVALLVDWSADGSDDDPLWHSVTGLTLMLVGIVIAAPPAFRFLRDVRLREQWSTPLLALDLAQRRELARQVSGRIPADPAHLPLARHLAESLVRQSPPPRMFLGLLILATGQLVSSPSWWSALTLAGFGLAAWGSRRGTRNARAFLDAHPEPRPA
ncbi:hypothetical protein SAMN05660485_01912 [Blastococcus fimeti]|nr:hypothetical protein SAMN05660485_01912 [Blastococcus fimeti]